MASIRKDRAENQPVKMILSDAEVAAVPTTSAWGQPISAGQVLKARQPH
jgi:hypothetical protein